MPLPRNQRRAALLASGIICLSALSLRAACLLQGPTLKFDEVWYLIVSHHLGTGQGYTDWRGAETHVHPLHPVLTAALRSTGLSLETSGRLTTLTASLLMLVPLSLLAGRLYGARGARLALLLVSLNLWLTRSSVRVEPESLYVLLGASALLLLDPQWKTTHVWGRWAAAGALFGVAYLARPEGIIVGALAGALAWLAGPRDSKAFASLGGFLAGLLLASAPFLVFLKEVTGGWVLTGKFVDLFQTGQALLGHAPHGNPFSQLAIREDWRGFLPFIAAQPGKVALGALRNGVVILGWILPRALGPAGIVGVLACGPLLLRRPRTRSRSLLVATPAVVLVLMCLTYPNERVIASVVPFLLVLASGGLLWIGERFPSLVTAPTYGITGVIILSLASWSAPLLRRLTLPPSLEEGRQRLILERALQLAGDPGMIVSNSPALSFSVGDPLLFGPPGRYRPLPQDASCQEVTAIMRERKARVAIISQKGLPRAVATSGAGCPLVVSINVADPYRDEWLSVLSMPDDTP